MKRKIAIVIALATALLGVAAVPASAATDRASIPGCQRREISTPPPYWVTWSDTFDMHIAGTFRTANDCPRDAIHYHSNGWSAHPGDCGYVTLRTFNDDGTTRRIWPRQHVCGRSDTDDIEFVNVDNNRRFRLEFHSDTFVAEWNHPLGWFTF